MEQVGEQHKGWSGGEARMHPQRPTPRPRSAGVEPTWCVSTEFLWPLLRTKGASLRKVTALPGLAHI